MDNRFIDGTRDVTASDAARMRYYRLMSEQTEWNAARAARHRNVRGNIVITPVLFATEMIVFSVYCLIVNIFKSKK